MSNVRTRIEGLLVVGCVVALMVAGATPAFAHHKEDHPQGQEEPASEAERFDQTDEDSSSGDDRSTSGRSRRKDSGSATTTAPADDGTADGEGKVYDAEGEPRGETSTSCTNDKAGASDPRRVYDNTCDGRASKAGNGGGSAQGRPCAGCVGNADDKNPKGQMPDGDHDGNAGYECDGNNGIARDNPAHTGCETPPTGSSTPMCPTNPLLPLDDAGCDEVKGRTDTSNPLKVCPSGPFKGMPMTSVRDCEVRSDSVLPNRITNRARAAAVLPFTGSGGVTTFAALGALLIVLGGLALRPRKQT